MPEVLTCFPGIYASGLVVFCASFLCLPLRKLRGYSHLGNIFILLIIYNIYAANFVAFQSLDD